MSLPAPNATPPAAPRLAWLPRDRTCTSQAQASAWLAAALAIDPATIAFQRDVHGRPQLQPPLQAWDCNWSHSGDGLLVAAGQGMQLGVDLEWRRPRPRALALAERFFAPPEWHALQATADDQREARFLRLWCAKEAVLKAHGQGLSFGLHRVVFAFHDDALVLQSCAPELGAAAAWTVRELSPAPGYIGAMAWRARRG